jgi:hypothetical protein
MIGPCKAAPSVHGADAHAENSFVLCINIGTAGILD